MTIASSSSSHIPKWIWLLLVLAVIATGSGIWRAIQERNAKDQALQSAAHHGEHVFSIPAQEWLRVTERQLQLGIPITGTLAAVDSAVIKARIPGELRELQLREGDSVRKGQVIARVDATEMEARYRQARMQAEAAQADILIKQKQHDNNRALVDKGFISETALTASQSGLQAARASHAAAQAAADAARKNLEDAVLRSPINGQIARRMAQNGERVNVESPVVEVVDLSALELQAQIPANDSAQVQIGQPASLLLRTSADTATQPLQAQVVRINPSASSSSRSVTVYLRVQPSAQVTLRPGMYVEGFIQTRAVETLAVPLTAVHTDQPLPYVQTVDNGLVQHTTVQLGPRSVGGDATWVAVQGLHADQIVLAGSTGRMQPGTRVQLQQPDAAPASSDA